MSSTHLKYIAGVEVPVEILERIFELTITGKPPPLVTLPPELSELPWLLGHVCSLWRNVSRSMSQFWEARICIGKPCHDRPPGRFSTYIRPDNKKAMQALRCAAELLPKGTAYVTVALYAEHSPELFTELISLRSVINALEWTVGNQDRDGDYSDVFPEGWLSQLDRLTWNAENINPEVDFFTDAALLRHLRLASEVPLFLFRNIPWQQLTSLYLATVAEDFNPLTLLYWQQFTLHNPIPDLPSLRELILDSRGEILDIILSWEWPWHQLTSLKIKWRANVQYMDTLLKPISHFKSMRLVILHNYGMDAFTEPQVLFPHLNYSIHNDAAPRVLNALASSTAFRSMYLCNEYLHNLYDVLLNCPSLVDIFFMGIHRSTKQLPSQPIIAPNLKRLKIAYGFHHTWTSTIFPTLLVAPKLTSLKIEVSYGSFPFDLTVDLIERSNAKLAEIRCELEHAAEPEVMHIDPGKLSSIFSLVSTASAVQICGVIFPDTILEQIANNTLLRNVTKLGICALDPDELVTVIQRRVACEEDSGKVTLRKIKLYCGVKYFCPEGDRFDEMLNTIRDDIEIEWRSMMFLTDFQEDDDDIDLD
ncbi:hypothetical protein H0H93_012396 [Arthromyces matolae]|nr:hypothetical protein H0H93_012396 [Arthromyces matolae]